MRRRNTLLPIEGIRGKGAMIAFDISSRRGSSEPDADATKRVIARACGLGLIVLSCGTAANTIRIHVPLTASDEILDEGLGMLEAALEAAP